VIGRTAAARLAHESLTRELERLSSAAVQSARRAGAS
jgi:hypothetical protein